MRQPHVGPFDKTAERVDAAWDDDGDVCPNCEARTRFLTLYGEMQRCYVCGAQMSEQEIRAFNRKGNLNG